MTDPVAARRAAIATEKERLARERERRRSSGPTGATGFAQRKWRWLGVNGGEAVEAVLELLTDIVEAPELTESQRATLAQALAGTPDREALLPEVRAGLATLEPASVLHHLRGLWAAGVRWLNEPGLERCRILCSTAPGIELVNVKSRAVSGGPAFSLFATAATRGAIPVQSAFLPQVLPWAPMSVIDDLVDHGGLLPEDEPWETRDEDDRLYLRARLIPEAIRPQEAESLGWDTFLRRRAFLDGEEIVLQEPEDIWDLLFDVVRDAYLPSIDALDGALPRTQQIELRNLKSGALNGQWGMETVQDRGLWKLMAALWEPKEPVEPGRSEFHARVALMRAYRLLKSGDLEAADRQTKPFTRARGAGRTVSAALTCEAYTLAAYIAAVNADLPSAEEHARKAVEAGGSTADGNLALVRAWRTTTTNNRGSVTNPFLELGLDHGADGWERHCRELFRQYEGEPARQARLNRAEDRIRDALRHEAGYEVFFQVPLNRSLYNMPDAVPKQLVPPLEPMARRTSLTSGADLESIRARAAVELLDDFRSTAPYLDRHGSAG